MPFLAALLRMDSMTFASNESRSAPFSASFSSTEAAPLSR